MLKELFWFSTQRKTNSNQFYGLRLNARERSTLALRRCRVSMCFFINYRIKKSGVITKKSTEGERFFI